MFKQVMKAFLVLLTATVAAIPAAETGNIRQSTGTKPATATVHVYRPKHVVGMALKPSIYFDGVEIHRLHNGTFFVVSLPSGKHMLTAGRSEVGQLVELEAGKDYYFAFGHKNWAVTAVANRQPITLSLVSVEEAQREMVGLRKQ
jgi:hypothetical protein